jgi:nitroreductase
MDEKAILECMETRRSVRAYLPNAVPEEKLERILRAGLYAASGMGRQSAMILCVTDKALRDRLMRMNAAIMGTPEKDPFYGAPCVLVVLADRSIPTAVYDGSLVLGNMMLAAHAEGLGSCWIHRAREEFDSDEGKAILHDLGVEGDYEGIGHLIVGYADGAEPEAKPRREGRVLRV